MPLDPYTEKMTIYGQVKKTVIKIWPIMYKGLNTITNAIFKALSEMIRSAMKSFKL